ncbi:glycosyl hydrolases family 18-domain-containing protein [Leucosporidium creatinivorum]|uniref:Glycosyl hydrolases family 18-domain-containing protein n=1 Tax=Leucosporidium creatinivorum TaxID=106004 RepID=A0A1Y2FXE6_9BASI|nr:glycosyl hydrolases family 18-domain-containing protein [Leucosporidium creatinivorum]
MYYFVTVTTATGMELPSDQSTEDIKSFIKLAKANNVTPIFTLGGWTGSQYFSSLAASASSRTKLAKQLLAFANKYGFEGVDVDWEYPDADGVGCNSPTTSDSANFLLLLKELRNVFGKSMKLTSAVSMTGFLGADGNPLSDVSEFASYLDFIQIMAYDVSGTWSATSGPLAPLHACSSGVGVDTAITSWTGAGFPASQILLGLPAYTTSFTLSSSQLTKSTTSIGGCNSQLYNAKTGTTPQGDPATDLGGSSTDICGNESSGYSGQWQMKGLISGGILSADEQSGAGGFTRYWDECLSTPFLFNSESKVLISYDDSESVKIKSEFAKEKGLAGVMVFDTQGYTEGVYSAMREALGFSASASSSSSSSSSSEASTSTSKAVVKSTATASKTKTASTTTITSSHTAVATHTTAAASSSNSSSSPACHKSSSSLGANSGSTPLVAKLSPSSPSSSSLTSAAASASASLTADAAAAGSAAVSILCTSSSTWSLCAGKECTKMGEVADGTRCEEGEIVWARRRERRGRAARGHGREKRGGHGRRV